MNNLETSVKETRPGSFKADKDFVLQRWAGLAAAGCGFIDQFSGSMRHLYFGLG
jgi:hypothetical protein